LLKLHFQGEKQLRLTTSHFYTPILPKQSCQALKKAGFTPVNPVFVADPIVQNKTALIL
jgi:hypothetical protein